MTKPHALTFAAMTEAQTNRLAAELAFMLRQGDAVALYGDLGAGKTTFARALIQALLGDPNAEVTSPTYTFVQTYDAPRFAIAHFDLYRISDSVELDEIGFEIASDNGVAIIEWPERAEAALPTPRFDIGFSDAVAADVSDADADVQATRDVRIRFVDRDASDDGRQNDDQADGDADSDRDHVTERLKRWQAMRAILKQANRGGSAHGIAYIQGDASARRYARLTCPSQPPAILMDWPAQPDGPPVRDGKPYSQIAHLAENGRAFVAVSSALRAAGLAAPRLEAVDLDHGLIVLEDFGDGVLQDLVRQGADQAPLWTMALDVLERLPDIDVSAPLPVAHQAPYMLPDYDLGALQIEVELLCDWYWPAVMGSTMPGTTRAAFIGAWAEAFAALLASPQVLTLRDFHSPNLIARTPVPDEPEKRLGLIDLQDAVRGADAYDVVSLFQDARVDVVVDLEHALLADYCARRAARHSDAFSEDRFRRAYAAAGAQRNTKILGIFARLAMRDGKPGYLDHIPRLWGYMDRNLAHPDLRPLKLWFDAHFSAEVRARPLTF